MTSVGSQSTIAANVAEDLTTQELVNKAELILAAFKQNPERLHHHFSDLPSSKKSKARNRVDPHALLEMMLKHAPNELGRRYVAEAIGKSHADGTTSLVELSNTWLRYLLVPCTLNNMFFQNLIYSIIEVKANRSSTSVPPSESATPTLDTDTAYNLDPHPPRRDPSMMGLVRLREGYRCPITEFYNTDNAPQNEYTLPLEVAHIIKRAVGVFDPNKDKGSLTTWDILKNFIGWDMKRTQEVVLKLDMPLNGMLLERNLHHRWDDFAWTLKPVVDNGLVVPDTYDVEEIRPQGFPFLHKANGSPVNRRITFQDRGGDQFVGSYMPDEDRGLIGHPRPLPDPELISLHRALCKVLHLSGAAEYIDSIFRDLGEGGVKLPSTKVRTTDELDLLLSTWAISPSLSVH
ncbi:hypothetical protein Clacol_006951 [Clathrus columnatus]|uniref:HNH nuclease domain-containing protein n=1 Tax=Clathrus columnatus TaxID=1419009 RepID=A0AAV5ADL0_9AGAM|nr:hypothetical protein Clacol_006951 [Clathrus columnatus]